MLCRPITERINRSRDCLVLSISWARERGQCVGCYEVDDFDTNALLRSDDSPDMKAFVVMLLCGGFEYTALFLMHSSLESASTSVTAGKKHGVEDRLDQKDLFFCCSASVMPLTGLLCARSSSSFFFCEIFCFASCANKLQY